MATQRSPATQHIPLVEPPWTLAGDVFCIPFYVSEAEAQTLPQLIYSPLESCSAFSDGSSGHTRGGLGMIQFMRYYNSPVGPYDEMLVVPGNFKWSCETTQRGPRAGCNLRISRIYVSQKDTCYNGRISKFSTSALLKELGPTQDAESPNL
jgi:hypothetical protein